VNTCARKENAVQIAGTITVILETNKGSMQVELSVVGPLEKAVITGGGSYKLPWPMGRLTWKAGEGSRLEAQELSIGGSKCEQS
jgi:hypothetical protein